MPAFRRTVASLSAHTSQLRSVLERLPGLLPWLYVALALPTIFCLALLTPPFQVADEGAHFFRAIQIMQDDIHGGSGESEDIAVAELVRRYAHQDLQKLSPQDRAAAADVRWSGKREMIYFGSTSVCPPSGYLMQALGVGIGQRTGLGVLHTLVLARLLNGCTAVLFSTMAILWCRGGRALVFVLLLLPMTLSLYASASPDAIFISCTALAFALVSRAIERGRPLPVGLAVLLLAALAIVVEGRPPYAPLLAVLLIPGVLIERASRRLSLIGLALGALIVALTVLWWQPSIAGAGGSLAYPEPVFGHVDPKQQLSSLIHQPWMVILLGVYVLIQLPARYLEMVGVLGWLDTRLSPLHYLGITAALLLAIAVGQSGARRPDRNGSAVIALSALGAFAAVFLIEYLIWTPVGFAGILGVQGRYLIPPALAAAMAQWRGAAGPSWTRGLAVALVVLGMMASCAALPWVLLGRYYTQ